MLNTQHNLVSILYTIKEIADSCLDRMKEVNPGAGGAEECCAQSVLRRISVQAARALEITKRLGQNLKETKNNGKNRSRVSVKSVWRRVIKILQREFSFENVEIIERIPEDFPPMVCDRGEFQEILYHLAKNAFQAMNVPSPLSSKLILRVQLAFSSKEEPCALISLSDTGPGIGQENLKCLFRPFFTTKPEAEGNGLGLYLTRELVIKNRGKISVSSFPGSGATFTLEFPISFAKETAGC
jgi:signal transduction histidine kinase